MISWRVYVVLIVGFYCKSVLSCYNDNDCSGYGESCCDGSYCSSYCSSDDENTGLSSVVLIILIICGVTFKILFWVAICYCRRRRYRGVVFQRFDTAPRTAVVVNQSSSQTQMMPPGYGPPHNPPVQGYNPPVQGYNPPAQGYNPAPQGYNPAPEAYNTPTPKQDDVFVNPANNPPPPYTAES